MIRTVVGVLRGGTSHEYPLSLKTGAAVLRSLSEDTYDARDILIDKGGYWYMRGVPADPVRVLANIDVVFNALHGGVGEDGSVQRVLDRMHIPYTGSRALPSRLSLSKIHAKRLFRAAGIPQPRWVTLNMVHGLDTHDVARTVFNRFGPPYVVKPPNDGASFGIRYVPTLLDLSGAIADVLDEYGAAIVEEYLMGDEARVGTIEKFRGESIYALPPAHVHVEEVCVSSVAHETGTMRYTTPSTFSQETKRELEAMAKAAHGALGLSHLACADFIVTPHGPKILEINALPGLYPGAAFPPMLESVGSSTREMVEHVIALARNQ